MVPLPPVSGSDIVRVLIALGFAPIDRGGNLITLNKSFRTVIVPGTSALLAPDEVRVFVRAANIDPSTFVDMLDRVLQREAG